MDGGSGGNAGAISRCLSNSSLKIANESDPFDPFDKLRVSGIQGERKEKKAADGVGNFHSWITSELARLPL